MRAVFQEGEMGSTFYVVLSGSVEVVISKERRGQEGPMCSVRSAKPPTGEKKEMLTAQEEWLLCLRSKKEVSASGGARTRDPQMTSFSTRIR